MDTNIKNQALRFLFLIGIISMFSDFTHEGARSIYGPYLRLIGASAVVVSSTAGFGEFIGQALRIVTGVIADKTKKYWLLMIVGYAINLLVIPLLMFVDASVWQVAIVLILLERVGKAIRAPAKSALTSFTTPHIGAGKAFALQEVMDQFGAFLGPIFVFGVLKFNLGSELNGYQMAFGLLGIFAIVTLVILGVAKYKYPHPDEFEAKTPLKGFQGNATFVWYLVAVSMIALGFIDYPLLAYHMDSTALVEATYIPLLYAFVMGVDAISALVCGILFDRLGVRTLQFSTLLYLFSAPIFFLVPGIGGILVGLFLWGIGMGAQESVLKAVISTVIAKDKRATAYGIFYAVFGFAWFVGSTLMGFMYETSLQQLVFFSMAIEFLAVILLGIVYRQQHHLTGGASHG